LAYIWGTTSHGCDIQVIMKVTQGHSAGMEREIDKEGDGMGCTIVK